MQLEQAPARPFRIAITLWAGLFPVNLMAQRGWVPEGFQLIEVADYDDTLGLLETGQVDANFQTLADTLPMVARGVDLKLVMASDLAVGVDGVVAGADLRDIQDLRGKRIGISPLTYSHILVRSVLARHGLAESDVVFVPIKGEQVPKALAQGEIDAGHTWGIHITEARDQGAHLLFTSAAYPGLLVDSLVVRAQALHQSPDHWKRFIRERERAIGWWREHPAEALTALSAATGLEPSRVSALFEGVTHYTQQDAAALFDRAASEPPSLYASGRLFLEFYRSKGVIHSEIHLDNILSPFQV